MSKAGTVLAGLVLAMTAPTVGAVVITTNVGLGADAEVRESFPDQNRGASTELATRVLDGFLPGGVPDNDSTNDHNSVMFLQFDLTGLQPGDAAGAILRLTYRNTNLTEPRVTDTDGADTDYGQNGLQYYGIGGAMFDEATITYNNAPGMTPDRDVGTKDFNASAVLLGEVDFPTVGPAGHLPVGGALDFMGAGLDAFLEQEILGNAFSVAVIAAVHRNLGLTSNPNFTKTGDEPADWINFNYLFNPKEQTTLNADPTSPFSEADNSDGTFSPQLILGAADVPAPGTWTLLALGVALVGGWRRRSVRSG